ncbi:MAG: hypothetical protein KC420_18305, partial [Myxococcales bacterium]|nr:hypothetical protein [Myxococcales bacterium]
GRVIRAAPVEPVRGRSLLSLRTVALDGEDPCHVKLAIDVVTTSARRTVSAMSVDNGPPLTRLLAAIQRGDPATGAGLWILGDHAGAGLRPEIAGERAAHLGVILRSTPERVAAAATGDACEAWVCAALGERAPASGRVLLAELASRHASVDELLARYVALLVPPALRLLSGHGIALELHLQNSLAVVGPRGLAGFVVRDLGGLRIHRARLAAAGHTLAFAPGSFIVTDDLAEVRDKLAHTLFHAHLAAIFRWAEETLGHPARRGWGLVRATLERCLDPLLFPEPAREAASIDRAALLAPRCRAKALLRMRVDGRISDYAYTEVDNVLAAREIADEAARLLARGLPGGPRSASLS